MDGKFIAVFIVLIVFSSVTIQQWIKYKAENAGTKKDNDEETTRLKAQVAELEERVKVLERIATDKSSRLKEEIDAL